MTDVLLVQPPIRDFYLTAKRTIPYGLASIAAALSQSGFTVALADALATRRARHSHVVTRSEPDSVDETPTSHGSSALPTPVQA